MSPSSPAMPLRTSRQQHLLRWMQAMALIPSPELQLVQQYGRWWTPAPLPEWCERLPRKRCFANALESAISDPELTYVEGYAQSAHVSTLHAWCVDSYGEVVDPTWDEPELNGYFGIAFDTGFAWQLTQGQGTYGLIGDGWARERMLRLGLVTHDEPYAGIVAAFGRAENEEAGGEG